MEIRFLQKTDWIQYRQIRLEALKKEPFLFADSYEEQKEKSSAHFQSELTTPSNIVLGGFIEGELKGIISLKLYTLKKMEHKAMLGRFYVMEDARGKSLGKKLFQSGIDRAKELGVEQLQLVVASINETAISVYKKQGFKRFAYEEKAMKYNGKYIDEEYFVLNLTEEK
ncbi:hypothetical protein AJ85_18740 [Alkalihalobacillus alcalophilus ATCC 27647 = CGMCC 1.3604]|uniref:N-acetyltransferase domain-containing protein n=1 Tax=Alkalihalobacillus alcalophilus ATCC 27647 = CGMCC 1.3604 TaxID=1218173 RepID=A0A094WKW0_ALKAL|nr:GNAT family N-acetyltransferase [Alkalihalobacillus alcalophilus]KGA96583.1 hypothetical protein BALCAV_0215260 [Alkalihalobacillus alcalophilus ATCC 27647 = CGMCC 1.3604]MED1561182.1 GNAT family N-acetyltransferase [Alkalihalobacillus alcalophilus]THG89267.1 hypothetical protein AJ85_18740 [Alkalihalobacillus alcalophilus ATCC 27647 = CGMCC 1.3604]